VGRISLFDRVVRESCLDTCNKLLECRLHRCGINATRDLVQSVKNIPKLVLVAEKQSGYFVLLILCDIRCTTVLNCTRHTCGANVIVRRLENISCWQTFDKELLAKLRSCGTICERPIEFCNHPCYLPCHPPKCPSDSCTKKVILRCKCKTIKQTVTCDIARAELKRLGILTFKTQILPCNPEHCPKKPDPKIENNPETSQGDRTYSI